jgi:hypothetical protein
MPKQSKKVLCSKCEFYSFPLRRCKLGRINPRSIKGGVDAARIMGLSYICRLSPLRAKIADRLLNDINHQA